MELGAAHWIYLTGMALIIAVMVARKNVVIPAVAATFATAWAFTGSFVTGLQSIFNASLTAAAELFSIFLIIALVTALLGALRALGADRRMIEPFRHVVRNGHAAFWVIALVTYVISLFFWPTPAVPLIGAILFPVAIRAGLPPVSAALAMAVAGQGMALSSDYVIQVAPGLSATAAGVSSTAVADRAMVLSLITGGVALLLGYLMNRRTITAPSAEHLLRWEGRAATTAESGTLTSAATEPAPASVAGDGPGPVTVDTRTAGGPPAAYAGSLSKAFAVVVPVTFAALVAYMMLGKFTDLVPETAGNEAAALVGGVTALLLLVATLAGDRMGALETCATHVVDGLVFSVRAMGIVIPIAGFFFIGNADFAGRIMGMKDGAQAPSFLFELVTRMQSAIPDSPLIVAFGLLIIGIMTGLDGSGFSGLPLTGSLAGSLGPATGVDPALLAAIGQMGAIWAGGGVLIAWSSLLAVAGFARVPVLDVVRKAFVPVIVGLVVAVLVGVAIY